MDSLNDQQIIALVVVLTASLLAAIGYLIARLTRASTAPAIETVEVPAVDSRYEQLSAQLHSVPIEAAALQQLGQQSEPEIAGFLQRLVEHLVTQEEQARASTPDPAPIVPPSTTVDQQRLQQLESQLSRFHQQLQKMKGTLQPLALQVSELQGRLVPAAAEFPLQGEGGEQVSHCVDNLKQLSTMVSDASEEIAKASDQVQLLETDSQNVGGVLDGIGEIAEQTNLLALNAAIEAARAGDQGRGFAVVADEVRTLAQRSQDFTAEIRQQVEAWKEISGEAMDAAGASREKMSQGLIQLHTFSESLNAVAAGGGERTAGSCCTQLEQPLQQIAVVVDQLQGELRQLEQLLQA